MTFAPPASPNDQTIYLHCEKGTACKDWAMSLVSIPGAKWKLTSQWGPASPADPSGKVTMKPKLAQAREYLETGVDFNTAATEFVRRVNDQLKQGYTVVENTVQPDITSALGLSSPSKSVAVGGNPLMAKLHELLAPTNTHKVPVLLDGPPGTGKTYNARQFGKSAGFHGAAEVAGNPALEAIDFLGGMIPLGGGKTIWMDGPVTRAFREASKGRKMLLIVDEYKRIPRRERGIFLNALTPHDGNYMLRTGRPVGLNETEGTAMMELLAAPVANLSIVATTNSGSNYPDVEDEDPAARERWHIVHVRQDENMLKTIVAERMTARGWPTSLADDFISLQKAIKKACDDSFAEKELSPRLTLRVVDLTTEPTKAGILKAAKEMIPALTARTPDGDIVQEQKDYLETTIKTALKA